MASAIKVEFEGLDEMLDKFKDASRGGFKTEVSNWINALGFEFLDIVQDEIIRLGVVDTRLLLNSFSKGNSENTWGFTQGGLSLEVGTNVQYASYVNDGHWTNPKGVQKRFVPGTWSGTKFQYNPNASTGMMLKQKWVEGYHYWESSQYIFERVFQRSFENKLQQWLVKYFE